ncbi:hypothetical protein GOP47_0028760 [Adiantum capillus-veneris]|nr:hypothetical protein GOP47_0028760 [Adiantum capillus-veneris]
MPRGVLQVMENRTKEKLGEFLLERKLVNRSHHRRYCNEVEAGAASVSGSISGGYQTIDDDIALVGLLKACAKKKDLYKGIQLHEAICNKGLLQKNIFIGSTLVHMYAKCGALTTAQQVFDELPVRNLVTWNALMAGYAQHGQAGKVLDCFEQMQGEGLSLDAVTFLPVLKACGSIGAIDLGFKLHEEILENGWLRTNTALGSALVDMYAKFGMLEKAQEVFDNLPVQNVVSWTGLILGYAQHGHGEQAIKCFDKMRDEGLSPNAITFACILKACGIAGASKKGDELHEEIAKKGLLQNDSVLGTALVDMYAKCGALAKAQEAFNELRQRDVVAWNALIAGYCQMGHGEEALKVFKQMKSEGFSPDAATFSCILRACSSIGSADKGKEIHDEIVERGLLRECTVLHTALVDMYAKCGAFKMAKNLLTDLPFQNVASSSALISGYCQHDLLMEALECFNQMQKKGLSPDAATFASLLRVCGRTGATEKGEELHAEIMRLGLIKKTGVIGSALVDMYVRFGALGKAQEVLDKLCVRDLVSWTALIQGYCQYGQGEKAVDGFFQMKRERLSPDEVTFACILKTCGSICAIDTGIDIHAEIEREGLLEKFDVLGSVLVDMYAKCGVVAKAQEVFDKLSVRDIVTWTALIDGYCLQGHGEEALNCFSRMRSELHTPDAVTFACILKVCGSIGAVESGQKMHDEIVRSGLFVKDDVLGVALVDMYAKCGALRKAKQVFDELPTRNVVTWNVLMSGYCQHGQGEEALKCFDTMKGEGVSPDAVTFVSILKACGSTEAVEEGSMYFEMMKTNYGIIPSLEHTSCMVEVLGRAGQFDKALAFVTKMYSCDQLHGWSALLSACRKRGNVHLGRLAFDHMVQLDEKCATAYVWMSNIYAAAGMQEQAEEVETMRMENQAWL